MTIAVIFLLVMLAITLLLVRWVPDESKPYRIYLKMSTGWIRYPYTFDSIEEAQQNVIEALKIYDKEMIQQYGLISRNIQWKRAAPDLKHGNIRLVYEGSFKGLKVNRPHVMIGEVIDAD